jgi:hypothetical protein
MPDADVDTVIREAAAAAAPAGDDDSEGDTEEEEEEGDEVDEDEDEDDDEELPAEAPAPDEEQPAPAPISTLPGNPNQLTLVFQGEVYVFESVTPEKVPLHDSFRSVLQFTWKCYSKIIAIEYEI